MSRKLLAAIVAVGFAMVVTPMALLAATAPTVAAVVTPAPNGNGWHNGTVTLSWTITGDPTPTLVGCLTATITTDQQTTFTCNASNGTLPTATATVTIKRDATKPDIVGTRTPAGNAAGWNNTDVLVSFSCTDATSGVATNTVGGGTLLTTDGANQSVTNSGTCIDFAGNTADSETVSNIDIDQTKPTISAATTTAPNGTNSWYKGNVTVAFTCADSLSLIDTCPANQVLSSEGAAVQSSALTATDNAGNVSNASNVLTVKIDKTAPTLAPSLPGAATEVLLNAVVSATPNATDAVSGVASSSCPSVATGALGTFSINCTATDKAGNTATASLSYTVVNQLSGTGTVLFGSKPPLTGGFGTFAFGGGTFAQLLTASGCPQATAVFFFNKPDGAFATWIPASTVAAVNAEIIARFASTIPEETIFTARCV